MSTRVPKLLAQGYLTTTFSAIYTTPASTVTQITEIWLTNSDVGTTRNVTLTANGINASNTIANSIVLAAKDTLVISDAKIVLSASATLGGRVDTVTTGTAQGATAATTITLATAASTTDSFYNGTVIQLTNNDPAGVLNLSKIITAYTGSTRLATVNSAWSTTPTSSTTYILGAVYITLFGIEEA